MKKWTQVKLGDLVELQSGGTPSKRRADYWNGGLPWVSPKDVKLERLHNTEETVTEDAVGNGTKAVDTVNGRATTDVFQPGHQGSHSKTRHSK
jgi:type I restriction enzyme, S subunit